MAVDVAIALKIADTAGIQDDFCQRQRGLRGCLGRGVALQVLGPGDHAEGTHTHDAEQYAHAIHRVTPC